MKSTAVVLIVVGVCAYVFRAPAYVFAQQIVHTVAPCTVPITYRIDAIDPRFDMSEAEVVAVLEDAEALWEESADADLFSYKSEGYAVIDVRFTYDLRQETTEQLRDIGVEIEDSLTSYESVEARYETMRAAYEQARSDFERAYAAYEADADAYEREVTEWNARGGAPRAVVERLHATEASLQARQRALSQQQDEVNALASDVNALVQALNHLARSLNANAHVYNRVGAAVGEEFEEAVYTSTPGKETIEVYEFDSRARLVRVLAHEFGHALGLEHVKDERAIMYHLNHSTNLQQTASDIAEYRAACRIDA